MALMVSVRSSGSSSTNLTRSSEKFEKIVLTEEERKRLERIKKQPKTPQKHVRRAVIVLDLARGPRGPRDVPPDGQRQEDHMALVGAISRGAGR